MTWRDELKALNYWTPVENNLTKFARQMMADSCVSILIKHEIALFSLELTVVLKRVQGDSNIDLMKVEVKLENKTLDAMSEEKFASDFHRIIQNQVAGLLANYMITLYRRFLVSSYPGHNITFEDALSMRASSAQTPIPNAQS